MGRSSVKYLPLVPVFLLLSACAHVPSGGAKEVHVSFGVPSVFTVATDKTGVVVTDTQIKVADSSTTVGILLFQWKSSGKDIVLPNPAPKP